jgi:hypothetical protein
MEAKVLETCLSQVARELWELEDMTGAFLRQESTDASVFE